MNKQQKHKNTKHIDLVLQPWSHEQQHLHNISSAQVNNQFNRQFISNQTDIDIDNAQRQRNTYTPLHNNINNTIDNNRQIQTGTKLQIHNNTSQSSSNKKYKTIDYIKKNQKNIHSYSLFSPNYIALLNDDDSDNFIPINPNVNNNNLYIKRPSINTTYIGYYDQEPFMIENSSHMVRSRVRKDSNGGNGKYWSLESKNRPKTTEIGNTREKSKSRVREVYKDADQIAMYQQFCDRTAYTVGNYHLQKVLKIKEKLRQKLRRNSEKRDQQRGIYLKSRIKIQQQQEKQKQKQKQSSIDNNFIYSGHQNKNSSYSPSKMNSAYQSRKSSFNSIENIEKQRKRIDKWKQYMKMQNQQRQKRQTQAKSPSGKNRANKFFGVVGGAIYK